ncbi:MAG: hypothetical protein P0Y64_16140 [Candidatus Sphingomonas colombiensis]|nr:hypothetical protein [Sphingomonas sp.]WEK42857.1 MAG: hypothetical protein P0Y64_16140 [Sphingomonas sp.]
MAISRVKVAAAALTAATLAAAAVAQSNKSPESLLPPGFGEPVAQPSAAPQTGAPAPAAPAAPASVAQPVPLGLPDNGVLPTPTPSATPTPDAATLAQYEMPAFARRSLALIGPTGTAEGGFAHDAWGNADGRFLEVLMRRLSAPLPSRWLSIALRRALVSQTDTPYGLNGADFAAERAWLLLRMGESVSARAVVQSVDIGNATPKLRDVWMQAALANADPGALCPLTDAALRNDNQPGWVLAQAMCAALVGEPGEAQPLIAEARRARVASGIDLQLAQKVIGAGADSRQAITIEWTPVVQLNAWRFGLATATGIAVPDSLYDTVGPQVTGWRALAPAIPLADRAAPGERAAAMGVLSNLALVDLYGAIDAADDMPAALSATASDLRSAYAGADVPTRLGALRQLWEGAADAQGKYARLILTARAAARVRPGDGKGEADRIIAAMLSAGMDRTAMRWRDTVAQGTDGWAMLMLADPDAASRIGYGQVSGYASARKQQLFFAGLAGLGRLTASDIERGAQELNVKIGVDNAWTRALDRATRERQPATVLLLAAAGMQTGDWRGVPPDMLYRIITALRVVGLGGEARMIAVEALTRI